MHQTCKEYMIGNDDGSKKESRKNTLFEEKEEAWGVSKLSSAIIMTIRKDHIHYYLSIWFDSRILVGLTRFEYLDSYTHALPNAQSLDGERSLG
mgnify:CR=1 FL=1